MGLEPTTFELEVQHASPLRHGGFTVHYVINLNVLSALFLFLLLLLLLLLLFGHEQNITQFPFNIFTGFAS